MRANKWLLVCLALAVQAFAESPPPLSSTGTVNEWDVPHRFHVPLGRYVLEADPIAPRGQRLGGVPTGDVGKALEVQPGEVTPAYVYYDPLSGPPEFPQTPGQKYIYVLDPSPPPLILEFKSRDEAVYYLGEDQVQWFEQQTVKLPDGTEVPVMSWQPDDHFQAEPYCRYISCTSIEQLKAQEAAERWESFVTAVSDVVEAIVEWILDVVEAIVNWFLSLFNQGSDGSSGGGSDGSSGGGSDGSSGGGSEDGDGYWDDTDWDDIDWNNF